MTTILAQLEIKRTSEKTKFGLMGAAKKKHFSGKAPIGYRKINKELVIYEVESEFVKDIFKSYLNGLSVCTITKQLNEKNALNRNWRTTTIGSCLNVELSKYDCEALKSDYPNLIPCFYTLEIININKSADSISR